MQRSILVKRGLAGILGAALATAVASQVARISEQHAAHAKLHEQHIAEFRNAWMADCL